MGAASAQQVPPPAPAPAPAAQPAAPPDLAALAEFAKKNFGASFTVTPVQPRGIVAQKRALPPIVVLTADLDADGVEDVVIVAQCAKPLIDAVQLGYKVADPYDAYFGFGDPRITQGFNAQDPEGQQVLLIVHGWRLPQPKAKFVIINLPFDSLAVGQVALKKNKVRASIVATESGLMEATIYWDGKKYRYEPGTADTGE